MTDFRALCAELVQTWDTAQTPSDFIDTAAQPGGAIDRARAALAQPEPKRRCIYSPVQIAECGGPCEQGPEHCDCGELWATEPEPEGPTKAELRQVFDDQSGFINDDQVMWWGDFQSAARAVLARWGRPTPQPADGEVAALATAEMVRQLRTKASTEKANRCHYSAKLLTRAADLLSRLSPPQPIPVSERLPGPGDCDAEGRCWWWRTDDSDEWWELLCITDAREYNARCGSARYTHWLPAHAVPVPADD